MPNVRKINELSVLLNLPQITQKAKDNHVKADYKKFSACTNLPMTKKAIALPKTILYQLSQKERSPFTP
ncbi:MAG: hypothetical protein F6K40_32740 [Okeania sp. SIO3I5]|uniref:hypothetical protein n=1 Tax=Okeania sp. SIO3I5 TaxID=2607805 RepID=UPI0013BB5806|nr:hypothetical protein [Okeania sp. SIO3I5]NEQ40734.1 hypothetical protein [Okeania sp. SIO3I5]